LREEGKTASFSMALSSWPQNNLLEFEMSYKFFATISKYQRIKSLDLPSSWESGDDTSEFLETTEASYLLIISVLKIQLYFFFMRKRESA